MFSENWKIPQVSFTNYDTKHNLTIKLFKGMVSFTVWGGNGKRAMGQVFNHTQWMKLCEFFKLCSTLKPGNSETMKLSKYNKESKQWMIIFTMSIKCSDSNEMYLTLASRESEYKGSFKISMPSSITIGDVQPTASERGMESMSNFVKWFQSLGTIMLMTAEKGESNRGGYNRGGNSRQATADDMPF